MKQLINVLLFCALVSGCSLEGLNKISNMDKAKAETVCRNQNSASGPVYLKRFPLQQYEYKVLCEDGSLLEYDRDNWKRLSGKSVLHNYQKITRMKNNYWLVKSLGGYRLEDHYGFVVRFFSMAADCKAYCMEHDLQTKYISVATPEHIIKEYENATNKEAPAISFNNPLYF